MTRNPFHLTRQLAALSAALAVALTAAVGEPVDVAPHGHEL